MTQFAAFLRGINVGGHHVVKMEDLCRRFRSLGFSEVSSYQASGNVVFSTPKDDFRRITKSVENELARWLGGEPSVMVRSLSDLREIVRLDPFRTHRSPEAKPYVTFLSEAPSTRVHLPLVSPHRDVEVVLIRGADAFSLSRPWNGRSGYPNNFLESTLGVRGTTRNWATVEGVAALSKPSGSS
jgi:uncharacterized protein (DUF1697 family)